MSTRELVRGAFIAWMTFVGLVGAALTLLGAFGDGLLAIFLVALSGLLWIAFLGGPAALGLHLLLQNAPRAWLRPASFAALGIVVGAVLSVSLLGLPGEDGATAVDPALVPWVGALLAALLGAASVFAWWCVAGRGASTQDPEADAEVEAARS